MVGHFYRALHDKRVLAARQIEMAFVSFFFQLGCYIGMPSYANTAAGEHRAIEPRLLFCNARYL